MFWTTMCIFAPDLVYRTQCKWVPLSKDVFTVVIYSFLGLFKTLFLMSILVPYIALLIIS